MSPVLRPPITPTVLKIMSLNEKLKIVVKRASQKLPAQVGNQLLALVEPQSLAIMAGVVVVWAGSQLFGVGEIADVILLVGGWIAFGGVAFSAGKQLLDFAAMTADAKSDDDLNGAADHLARAVALLGVQTVLALLLRKPGGTLKDQYFATPHNVDPLPRTVFENPPSNRWWGYKPTIQGDPALPAGVGGTDVLTGDITYSLAGSLQDQQLAKIHESIHQFLTPKLNVLRGLRGFMRAQGYNRSYILRYLEEALAETTAQLRVKGVNKANLIEGFKFPVANGYITVAKLQAEAKGLLLGPINVGGQIYNVWYSHQ